MVDVLVKREPLDAQGLKRSIEALEREGRFVWLNAALRPGETMQSHIDRVLENEHIVFHLQLDQPPPAAEVAQTVQGLGVEGPHADADPDRPLWMITSTVDVEGLPPSFVKVPPLADWSALQAAPAAPLDEVPPPPPPPIGAEPASAPAQEAAPKPQPSSPQAQPIGPDQIRSSVLDNLITLCWAGAALVFVYMITLPPPEGASLGAILSRAGMAAAAPFAAGLLLTLLRSAIRMMRA